MEHSEKKSPASVDSLSADEDNHELIALGYKPSFKREFTNLPVISFAFNIMGVGPAIAMTFNTPLTLGGPTSVVWCWILGSCMCFTLAASIAEIVSAYPTCGGMYSASAYLTPKKHRAKIGWLVGWLNFLGQIAAVSSSEFSLSTMTWAAIYIGRDGNVEITQGKIVGLFVALLAVHGSLNSLATKHLARMTAWCVFSNIGIPILLVTVLLATTPRHEMHPAEYVFGSAGLSNQTGGWNMGLAFLLGLLSVQWTMTDYDATGHISEEVRRAAYAAPAAIFISVVSSGLIGWLLNIVLILCSGPLENLPGPSGSAVLQIMYLRMGKAGALTLWTLVIVTGFFCIQNGLQALSRMTFALSRDHAFPDRGFFRKISETTKTPLRAVWLAAFTCVLPGLLDFASPIAANAVFALAAIALDLSYIIPITLKQIYKNHPEVMFKPGPFYMGDGILGRFCNIMCIFWTLFVAVILSMPTVKPVTAQNMNYASVITLGVLILSFIWYVLGAYRHYHGPLGGLRHPDNSNDSRISDEAKHEI